MSKKPLTTMPIFSGISRRRLLQALALSPLLSTWPALAASRPDLQRIIALEWLPAELLMALGVVPMAIADTHDYQVWVKEPALPASVINVGQRTEPNMELMQQLEPSLLLISREYGPNNSQLTPIAPVLMLTANDGTGKPLQQSIRSLNLLATHLALPQRAAEHIARYHALLEQTRLRVQAAAAKPLLLITFLDTRHVLVFGANSLFQEVMDDVGLTNAWQEETSFWGSISIGIERLAAIKDAHVLCFDHDSRDIVAQVSRTPLWQSLSFVRSNQFSVVPAVWYYGSTFSAMRFCHLLSDLLGKPA
ncbi:Fe(3+)-hydroxamate ABC transporter substrate-binding protein FhuD [Rouxiella sp. Mn2063]|uniref:Fe(3+)-hydroxamate ABC transporter substrate-binding protein FhuD n=1 Tax=Rouxiella sp. Mn2063 TaxID=3395262 RepID=UPI003BD10C7C